MKKIADIPKLERPAVSGEMTPSDLSDAARAMSDEPVADYSEVPLSVFADWVNILRMNDGSGSYRRMLSPEKRDRLVRRIRKWKEANLW